MTESSYGWPERVPSIWTTPAIIPAFLASLLAVPLLPLLILVILMTLFGAPDWTLTLWAVVGLVVVALLSAVTIRLRRRDYARVQADRDRFAVEVAAALEQGEVPPPFSLYLRPFFTDGRLTDNEGLRDISFDVTEIGDFGQKRDLERACAKALEVSAPLISLGRPDERLGAGRIETSDDNWKALFDKLIAHAARVIMVPIGQPATLEEVKTIAGTPDLLAKTVFVRPADRRSNKFTFRPDPSVKSIGGMWEWTRREIADRLPGFPRFAGGPRMIAFPPGEPPVEYPGNGWSIQQASGVKTFLAEGRTSIATLMVLLALWPTLALSNAVPVRLPLFLDIEGYGFNPDLAQAVAGMSFLQTAGPLSIVAIMFYKLFSADLPRAVALPVTLFLVLALVSCVIFSYSLSDAATTWPLSQRMRFQGVVIFLGSASRNLLIGVAAAVLTGGRLNWRHVALIVAVPLLAQLIRLPVIEHAFATQQTPPRAFTWLLQTLSAGGIAVAMAVPIVARADGFWRKVGVTLLAILMAALAYISAELFYPTLPLIEYGDDPCYEMSCELPRWVKFNWASYRAGLVFGFFALAGPLVVRWVFKIGRERRWAPPI